MIQNAHIILDLSKRPHSKINLNIFEKKTQLLNNNNRYKVILRCPP